MKDPETFERKTVGDTTFEEWKKRYIKSPKKEEPKLSKPVEIPKQKEHPRAVEPQKPVKEKPVATEAATGTDKTTNKVTIDDVTEQYKKSRNAGKGQLSFDKNFAIKEHPSEMEIAKWVLKNIGGNIKLLQEVNAANVRTPDYIWNGKYWDLKEARSINAIDKAIRHGVGQIENNPGGFIIKWVGPSEGYDVDKIKATIKKRLERSAPDDTTIVFVKDDKLIFAIKRKK